MAIHTTKYILSFIFCLVAALLYCQSVSNANTLSVGGIQEEPDSPDSNEKDSGEPAVEEKKAAFLVRLRLPINGRVASQTQQAIQKILDDNNELVRSQDRPTVVLSFEMSRGATGQGSSLGACIDLARFLTSREMNRVKTVAYVPGPSDALMEDQKAGQLKSHAVLVALAANQIAIAPNVELGAAGIDEENIDDFVLAAYRDVVSKRLTIPVPIAMSMLDKSAQLFRVITDEGPVYVDGPKLREMEADGAAPNAETLSDTDRETLLSGNELVEFGIIRKTTSSLAELARQLGVSLESLQSELNRGKLWKAVKIEMPDYIDEPTIQWVTRSLEPKISSGQANLVLFDFDSTSGDVEACLQMARRIAGYDPNDVRTVAYINSQAAGPAALIALSCYHVIFKDDGKLGGEFSPAIEGQTLKNIQEAAEGIADSLGKDAATLQAMVEPGLEISRFRNKQTGEDRILTDQLKEKLVDADKWIPEEPLDFSEPINANIAEKLKIARQVVSGVDELESFYQLENEPESLTPTSIDRWLQQTALFLASPFVAPWLLFLAMFFIFNEISQPGLGVPGFLGTICLILYFWSQHLDGNANWLEIMLFVAGAGFLLIEIFVLPGFGLFGIGGLIMIVVSIVLASQTFVFPTTTEQLNQLPKSLFALAGAVGGMIVAMVALRTILPNSPYFKKIMLEPPSTADSDYEGVDRESVVNWAHLVGKQGIAVTNLVPAGKARVDGQLLDVITEGRLIEKDTTITVIEVAGNRVVVATDA